MNAKKLKEINQKQAYNILEELLVRKLWDPVVTHSMTDLQCENRFNKALMEYFKTETNLLFWNKNSCINMTLDNKEIIPMMKDYNFHTYKEENNL